MNINYFPWLTISFAVGILLGQSIKVLLIPMILLFVTLTLVAYFVERPLLKEFIFLAVFFVLGAIWGRADAIFNLPKIADLPKQSVHNVVVSDVPNVTSFGMNFVGKVKGGELDGRSVLVKIRINTASKINLQRGDILAAKGELNYIEETRNPGQFNFKKYYYIRSIEYQFIVGNGKINIVGHERPNVVYRLSDYMRNTAEEAIARLGKGQAAAVFAAMISGDKKLISNENIMLFQNLGLMHLFAISGLNVGIIVIILLFFLKKLKLSPLNQFVIIFATLFVYAGVAGFSVSVMRALIVALFYLVAKMISKNTAPLIPISLAAFILLTYNPRLIGDIGFLLTFGCVISLILFMKIFSQAYQEEKWGTIFAPIAAQLLILPILISNFHVFGLAQLLMAVPSAILSFPLVFMGFLTIVFAPIAELLANASAISGIATAKILLVIANFINSLPLGEMHFAAPRLWQSVLFYIFIATIYIFYVKGNLTARNTAILFVLAPLLLLLPHTREGITVTFIDVGQGDAILLEFADGKNILVDGGGATAFPADNDNKSDYDVGLKVVIPVLFSKGIDRLDYIIATHPHSDHIGGLAAVLNNVKVNKLLISPYQNEELLQLKKVADKNHVKIITPISGSVIKCGDARLEFIAPVIKYNNTRSDANNSSLVLLLDYDKTNLLLTGDIEQEAMADIVEKRDLEKIMFFKIPHHGSKYSMEKAFLKEIKPSVAIVSVGKNNYFGHPAKEVISYWQQRKTPILRTDQDGAVEIFMTKERSYIKTYLSRKRLRINY